MCEQMSRRAHLDHTIFICAASAHLSNVLSCRVTAKLVSGQTFYTEACGPCRAEIVNLLRRLGVERLVELSRAGVNNHQHRCRRTSPRPRAATASRWLADLGCFGTIFLGKQVASPAYVMGPVLGRSSRVSVWSKNFESCDSASLCT